LGSYVGIIRCVELHLSNRRQFLRMRCVIRPIGEFRCAGSLSLAVSPASSNPQSRSLSQSRRLQATRSTPAACPISIRERVIQKSVAPPPHPPISALYEIAVSKTLSLKKVARGSPLGPGDGGRAQAPGTRVLASGGTLGRDTVARPDARP